MNLTNYVTLGRSGLRVSPAALGTMTFGNDYGWGMDEAGARQLFDRYVEAGGNFFDTADLYTNGNSERMLGKFVSERKLRDRAVIATKFTFNMETGNPNSGGNGRKNIRRAIEASLERLGTDYVDVYFLHAWDMHTPVEEVASTLDDLVRQGKVRYVGLSDVPAWYAARYQSVAEQNGWAPVSALQLEYSLLERTIEREHVPMARSLGMAITPWSPLASGLLSGKYSKEGGQGRIESFKGSDNPVFQRFADPSARAWSVVDTVKAIATELGKTPAEIALAWVFGAAGITSTILGATKLSQLETNLGALELVLPEAHRAKLDAVSALESVHPYMYFGDVFQKMIHGGASVRSWTP